MHFIYQITNKLNKKIYIGQTNKPQWRWQQHIYYSKYPTQLISKAIAKYGKDNFDFTVIFFSDDLETINYAEEFYINLFDSKNKEKGYNVANGGGVGNMSQEMKDSISNGLKKYYKTHKSPRKGVKYTEEFKQKLSQIAMGKKGTNNGKKFTEEHKRKISESLTGKKRSPNAKKPEYVYRTPPNKKITDDVALKIRAMENTHTRKEIADKFNLTSTNISDILSNKTHRHLLDKDAPIKCLVKKLTKEKAKEIKDLLAAGTDHKEIMLKYSITKKVLKRIISGETFKNDDI